jgi:hypothetical protein
LPTVLLPVQASSNLATLVELAARDWMLREDGINAAQRLDQQLQRRGRLLDSAGDSAGDVLGNAERNAVGHGAGAGFASATGDAGERVEGEDS